jgi:hypothetical protein
MSASTMYIVGFFGGAIVSDTTVAASRLRLNFAAEEGAAMSVLGWDTPMVGQGPMSAKTYSRPTGSDGS